jgi:hypothetical protein
VGWRSEEIDEWIHSRNDRKSDVRRERARGASKRHESNNFDVQNDVELRVPGPTSAPKGLQKERAKERKQTTALAHRTGKASALAMWGRLEQSRKTVTE